MTKADLTLLMLESYIDEETSYESISESLNEDLLDVNLVNLVFECANELSTGNVSRFTNLAVIEAFKESLISKDFFSALVENGIINLNGSISLAESVELSEGIVKKIGKTAAKLALYGGLAAGTVGGGLALNQDNLKNYRDNQIKQAQIAQQNIDETKKKIEDADDPKNLDQQIANIKDLYGRGMQSLGNAVGSKKIADHGKEVADRNDNSDEVKYKGGMEIAKQMAQKKANEIKASIANKFIYKQ